MAGRILTKYEREHIALDEIRYSIYNRLDDVIDEEREEVIERVRWLLDIISNYEATIRHAEEQAQRDHKAAQAARELADEISSSGMTANQDVWDKFGVLRSLLAGPEGV